MTSQSRDGRGAQDAGFAADRPADPRRQIRSHTAGRGIAALIVVGYHLQFGLGYHLPFEWIFKRGYLLVDLFFILSGFILSYVNNADRAISLSGREYRGFLRARLARIYPLHAFCLAYLVLIYLLMIVVFRHAGHGSLFLFGSDEPSRLVAQMLLLTAFVPLPPGWNIPSWSISAEMGAYLLFPVLIALHTKARRATLIGLALYALIFYAIILMKDGNLDITVGWGWLRCLAGFFVGMLMFYARSIFARLTQGTLSVVQLIALAGAFAALLLPVPDPLVVPAFALIVGSTWTDRGILNHLLSKRAPQWLGNISYSIYLNHACLITAIGFVFPRFHLFDRFDPWIGRSIFMLVIYCATLIISHLTFNYVERPARQWLTRRWTGHAAPPIASAASAP